MSSGSGPQACLGHFQQVGILDEGHIVDAQALELAPHILQVLAQALLHCADLRHSRQSVSRVLTVKDHCKQQRCCKWRAKLTSGASAHQCWNKVCSAACAPW